MPADRTAAAASAAITPFPRATPQLQQSEGTHPRLLARGPSKQRRLGRRVSRSAEGRPRVRHSGLVARQGEPSTSLGCTSVRSASAAISRGMMVSRGCARLEQNAAQVEADLCWSTCAPVGCVTVLSGQTVTSGGLGSGGPGADGIYWAGIEPGIALDGPSAGRARTLSLWPRASGAHTYAPS